MAWVKLRIRLDDQEISGELTLNIKLQDGVPSDIEANRAVIPYALVGSDKIDVGAKGLVDSGSREGIFYVRFRKLHGILKVKDGDRNFDIFGARKKFDDYTPGETPLSLTGVAQPESTAAALGAEQETSENFIAE